MDLGAPPLTTFAMASARADVDHGLCEVPAERGLLRATRMELEGAPDGPSQFVAAEEVQGGRRKARGAHGSRVKHTAGLPEPRGVAESVRRPASHAVPHVVERVLVGVVARLAGAEPRKSK